MSEVIPERVRGERSVPPEPSPVARANTELKAFPFEVVRVDERGQEVKREKGQAQYFTEDLGKGVELEMVYIPGGEFMMGSPKGEGYKDEKPQHKVTVQPFFMGKFQVIQAQWRALASLSKVKLDLETDPFNLKGDNLPVETISWSEAQEFCQRLSKQVGREYRLPSEAEWEYACRAGTTTPFHFGEMITDKLANYGGGQTTPVGSFSPNAFGLYDLHGLVWEWCEDDWHGNYENAPNDGSAWSSGTSSTKVRRGGSCYDAPVFCRSACRNPCTRDGRSYNLGLRVVCVA